VVWSYPRGGEIVRALRYPPEHPALIALGVDNASDDPPSSFALMQNYPNPFNPTTAISYQLPAVSKTKISVSNLLGQVVATLVDGYQEAGTYTIQFDAGNLASGVYLCRLQAAGFSATRRMVLVR